MRQTIERVQAEFVEMPGLKLTAAQVARLFGIERQVCEVALDALVDAKFLRRRADGTYARAFDGQIRRPQPLKAGHEPFVLHPMAKGA